MSQEDSPAVVAAEPGTWRMHGQDTPALAEYLLLAADAGWGNFVAADDIQVTFGDALIVLDMQNDHLPVDDINPHGGSIATLEASSIVPLVLDLMQHFSDQGGMVVATRDYHPTDHCSFIDSLGPFPTHCVQGSAGSHFYNPIGECIQRLRQDKFGSGRCEVIFKGFHEDIDSPGGFEYVEEGGGPAPHPTQRESSETIGGCPLSAWTGASLLKCSNLDTDVNAPPDILASHRRISLPSLLNQKSVKRLFICGLRLDYSVLETAVNAASAGFSDVSMILDATRAAHLSGVGQFGSGFIQDPSHLTAKLSEGGVKLVPSAAVLPNLTAVNPIRISDVHKSSFPSKLGPFHLVRAKKISLYVDRKEKTYRAVAPLAEIRSLEKHKVKPEGTISPPVKVTLSAEARTHAGIPENADTFTYAYPLGAGTFLDVAHAYFAITTPSAAFFVYGGFIYFDTLGKVVAVMAIGLGSGLSFNSGQPWPAAYTTAIEDRWCPVTAPFLRDRGARMFAWINPGETLTPALGGEKLELGNAGAFAYLFHEDISKPDDRDVFFCVNPNVDVARPANIGRCAYEEKEAVAKVRTSIGAAGEERDEASGCVMAAFQEWDIGKSGTITEEELTKAMKKLDPTMTEATIAKLFKSADSNRDGVIQFEEFVKWIYSGTKGSA